MVQTVKEIKYEAKRNGQRRGAAALDLDNNRASSMRRTTV